LGAIINFIKFIIFSGLFLICLGVVWYWKGWSGKILFVFFALVLFFMIRGLLKKADW